MLVNYKVVSEKEADPPPPILKDGAMPHVLSLLHFHGSHSVLTSIDHMLWLPCDRMGTISCMLWNDGMYDLLCSMLNHRVGAGSWDPASLEVVTL